MDLDLAVAQRGSRFEADEAGADDERAAPLPGTCDQLAAVGERSERPNMRQLGARQLQPDRLGAGGEQQLVEAERLAAAEYDAPTGDIERRGRRAEAQLDRSLGI